MEIRVVSEQELSSYDRLTRDYGTIFCSVAWTDLFEDHLTRYGIYEDGGELIGGFCLYRDRNYGFTILRDPPFTPMCGPFIRIKATNPVAITETRRRVLSEMARWLDRKRCPLLYITLTRGIDDALPFYWNQFKVIPTYTYVLDLSLTVEQIWQHMSPVRRNDISKATRDGLSVCRITDMGVVRGLVQESFQRQHKTISIQHLDSILFKFASDSNSFTFAAYEDEIPVACAFVIHDAHTAYYLLGGLRLAGRHHGAGAFALFESIRYAKQIGLRTFDFEGSVIPSIEKYFRGFGGKLTPYFTVNKAWLPLEIVLKFIKRERF